MKTNEVVSETKIDLQHAAIADFRRVTLTFRHENGCSLSSHVVHKDEVDRLIEASKSLHYDPGVNPYNGGKTSQIIMISVAEPYITGPYWWSTPGLGKTKDESSGASLINWSDRHVWLSPEYEEELRLRGEFED